MAFTPKEWKNFPDTSTIVDADSLMDIETRVTDYTDDQIAAGVAGDFSGSIYLSDLDITYTTDEASTIQAAIDAAKAAGGGTVVLPATNPGGNKAIKIGSRITVPQYVNLIGQGKYTTELKCSAAGAGILMQGVGDTPSGSRGGSTGHFCIDGNQIATTVMEVHSVNRVFPDLRIENPKTSGGIALYLYGAQNNNFFGLELEDQYHTASSLVKGVVIDGSASGNNFYGNSINEFTDGHVVSTATSLPSGMAHETPENNCFFGNMIERTDSGNPIIKLQCASNMHFYGGNIAMGEDFEPTGDCSIVSITNDAPLSLHGTPGGSGSTRAISFSGINFTGALGAGAVKWMNAFELSSDLNSWHDALYVDPSCKYANCKYLARINAGSVAVNAHYAANSSGGGLSAGWSNPLGTGKINTRKQSSAGSITVIPFIDRYELSGNTNLTTFTATYSGHRVSIYFSGTPTVSHGTGTNQIALSGSTNMTASAGTILFLECNGTYWDEIGRKVP